MELDKIKEKIKQIALDSGAKLVGVGSRERLENAPPSADMDYVLAGAQSCIIWAYPNKIEDLESFFSKKERWSLRIQMDFAYLTAWSTAEKIKSFIEENTDFKAHPVVPNGKYRGGYKSIIDTGEGFPPFSLRYGGVAAGLGHIGWSGNLVTPEYGGSIFLGGVVTTAPLEADPMAEINNCNKCMICQKVCTTGYVIGDRPEDRQPVIIGGVKQNYGKRGPYMKCGIGCAGLAGLCQDESWSTWTPDHICLKNIPEEELTSDYILKLQNKLIRSKETPRALRRYNQAILASFAKAKDNVANRPLEDTNPRCGNCSFICVKDPKKRNELFQMLKSSGKVYLDENGREFVRKINKNGEETIYYPPTWEEYKISKGID